MDHEPAADDAVGPGRERNARHLDIEPPAPVLVRLKRRQIARMVLARSGVAMRLAVRVEMPSSAHAVAGAAVAHFMDMEAMLLIGLEALHVHQHVNLVAGL